MDWVRNNGLVHREETTLNNGAEDIANHIWKVAYIIQRFMTLLFHYYKIGNQNQNEGDSGTPAEL